MLYKPSTQQLAKKIGKYDKGKKLIFVSQASINMCWARMLCKFVLEKNHVPVNYFTVFGHFVHELADLSTMIDSINAIIVRCDELWAFGEISEGMWFEIKMCKKLGIPLKYFSIDKLPKKIYEIDENDVKYLDKFKIKIDKYKNFVPINQLKS